jgi:nicotinamide mononucleotide (NMN) deamidase PncC
MATSGVAGPVRQEGKPVGTLCIWLACGCREGCSLEVQLSPTGRDSIREAGALSAMRFRLARCDSGGLQLPGAGGPSR